MSKQDRQGVRTASDIERKYDLGQIAGLGNASNSQNEQLSRLNQALSQFMVEMNAKIEALQSKMYPIGSVYIGLDSTNPAEIVEGEWELIAEGHLNVGLDNEDEDVNELFQTDDIYYLWKRIA